MTRKRYMSATELAIQDLERSGERPRMVRPPQFPGISFETPEPPRAADPPSPSSALPAPQAVARAESAPAPAEPPVAGPATPSRGRERAARMERVHWSKIEISPLHNRIEYTGIEELAQSMTAGQAQPAAVRPLAGQKGRYELFIGARRWRSAKQLDGYLDVAVYDQIDNAAMISLIHRENHDRVDMTVLEQAAWYRKLLDTPESTIRTVFDLSVVTGLDRSYLYKILSLNDINKDVLEYIHAHEMGARLSVSATLEILELCKEGRSDRVFEALKDAPKKIPAGWFRRACMRQVGSRKRRKSTRIVNQAGAELGRVRVAPGGGRVIVLNPGLDEETVESLVGSLMAAARGMGGDSGS